MARFERRTSALELLWRGLDEVPSANADIEGEGVMEDLRMVGEISKQRRLLAQFVRRAQSKLTVRREHCTDREVNGCRELELQTEIAYGAVCSPVREGERGNTPDMQRRLAGITARFARSRWGQRHGRAHVRFTHEH